MAEGRAAGTAAMVLASVLAPALSVSASRGLAIVGATVVDGTGAAALPDAVLLVDGERVSALGPRAHVALPKGIPYVDGRGRFVVPARLADARVRADLKRRLEAGASFEEAAAGALRQDAAGPPDTLERGRYADLLVLEKDPRGSLENLGSVSRVFARGQEQPRLPR